MTTWIKDSVQKILDIIDASADATLSGIPTESFLFGAPKTPPSRLPAIYCQFNGLTPTGKGDVAKWLYVAEFEVGIIDSDTREDNAEKSVYDKIEAVFTALDTDETLSGNMDSDKVEPRPVTVDHLMDKQDYAFTVAKI